MSVAIKQNSEFTKSELSSSAQIAFYDYWQSLKHGKSMPSRDDFDPMAIPSSLPYIVVMDVTPNQPKFKVRLAGSKCGSSHSSKGKYINDMPDMKPVLKLLIKCVETKSPNFYFTTQKRDNGLIRFYSSLIVPFSSDDKNVNYVMACHCPIE